MLLILVIALAVVLAIALVWQLRQFERYRKLHNPETERAARADASKRSRIVRGGNTAGQFHHLHPYWPWDDEDARAILGGPVDLIVFDGLRTIERKAHPDEQELQIVFVDVKSGKAGLSRRQRAVRNAVEANRVKFVAFNSDRLPDTSEDSGDAPGSI